MEYLTNTDDQNHAVTLNILLKKAIRLDCIVAFAKMSGFNMISEELHAALKRKKFEARFVVGLDFYQTEPILLNKLFTLSKKYNLSLFISNSKDGIFHPKVYAFQNSSNLSYVVIGSANLTGGGLLKNNEASTLIKSKKLMRNINEQIEQLIKSGQVILATRNTIDSYEKEYKIHNVRQILVKRRTKNALKNNKEGDFETLQNILELMKLDETGEDFESQTQRRLRSRNEAKKQLDMIIKAPNINQNFIALYEPLVQEPHLWHSGGLFRGKNIIAKNAEMFQLGLKTVKELQSPSPSQAYSALHKIFNQIPNAGVNVITEILHTIDNKKFAVMNKNSVSGMSLANYDFPKNPNKQSVNAEMYEDFCSKAKKICVTLNLNNFTELDALFNYAYWD